MEIGPYGVQIMTAESDGEDTVQKNGNVGTPQANNGTSPKTPPRQVASFLKPLPVHIDDNDIEYLWAKGILSIPLPQLRHELLISYINHVHSAFPILDLNDLLRALEFSPGGEGQELSLLLFQAVMFTATAFIDLRHLHSAGFSDRKVARRAFQQNARVSAYFHIIMEDLPY